MSSADPGLAVAAHERDGATAAPGTMLEARGLRKSYGDVAALDGVDVTLARGEILGLLGPNGAGKTTLVSLIAGLRRPDAGTVRIGGIDVAVDPIGARRLMGIAPQDLGIYLTRSVTANLRYFGQLLGLNGRSLTARMEAVTDALDLGELLDRKASDLSGGEQRRLHTAMAMLGEPPLLLLDEPTAGVDVHTRNRLLEVVKSLARNGTAVCYTTHYLHEVEALNASVMILDHGSVIARGALSELIAAAGGAVLEIRMNGPIPPALAARGTTDDHGSVVRMKAPDAGSELTAALALVGDAADRIESVEIVRPSLESVYLSVTGRRFESPATKASDNGS